MNRLPCLLPYCQTSFWSDLRMAGNVIVKHSLRWSRACRRSLRGFEGDFVEDALGEFVDRGAGAAAAINGVAGDAGKDELRFLAVFVDDFDLHSGLGKLFANGCGRIVIDFVGLILSEFADEIGAGRRRSFLIGRLLEDETAAGALDTGKGAVQIVDLSAGDIIGHDVRDLLIAQIDVFVAQNRVEIVVDLEDAGPRKIARVVIGAFLFSYL